MGQKSKKNFPGKLSTKKIYSCGFRPKKYAQGGSAQVSLTITGQLYEENDKSKLETKRDVFNLNSDCWVNIVEDYGTLIDTAVGQTQTLKSSTFSMYYSQIFTDQTARNLLEYKLSCVLIHIHKPLCSEDICAFHSNNQYYTDFLRWQ